MTAKSANFLSVFAELDTDNPTLWFEDCKK